MSVAGQWDEQQNALFILTQEIVELGDIPKESLTYVGASRIHGLVGVGLPGPGSYVFWPPDLSHCLTVWVSRLLPASFR